MRLVAPPWASLRMRREPQFSHASAPAGPERPAAAAYTRLVAQSLTGSGESNAGPPSLMPLLLVQFIGTLGFSIVLPFLVFLVTRWGGNAVVYGLVGATYSAFQLVGAPILGRWSDTRGRKRVLLLSQAGTLVSWLVFVAAFFLPTRALVEVDLPLLGQFALTLPLVVLFFARAADGLTGGNISVANAYVADVTPEDRRSESFGKMAVAQNLGFIAGPALAALLASTAWGELLPVLAAVGISLIATLVVGFGLPESRPCEIEADPLDPSSRRIFGQEPRPCFEGAARTLTALELLRLPGVAHLLCIQFLVMLAFNFFYVYFPVYAVQGLEWSVRTTGAFFALMSFLMVLVQGPLLGRVSKVVSERTLILVGGLILSLSFLLFTSSEDGPIFAGAALLALGNGLMWPSIVAVLSKRGGDHQGAVQGLAGSGGAVASILGLVLGGILYGFVDAWIFGFSFALVLLVVLLSLGLPRRAVS